MFLHARKLLQMADVPHDRLLYRANFAMNLFTFVFCRFLPQAWIAYGLWIWHARVLSVHLAGFIAALLTVFCSNAILLWRLLCNDLMHGRRQKQPTSSHPEIDPKTDLHLNSNDCGHSTKSAANGIALNDASSLVNFHNNHAQQYGDTHSDCSNNSVGLSYRTSVKSRDVSQWSNE